MSAERYIYAVKLSSHIPRDSYLWDIPAIAWLSEEGELPINSAVTFLVGENGSGKSTLLEAVAVACGFNAEGGSRNFSFSTADTHSELCEHITAVRGAVRPADGFFLRAESFYNVASYLDSLPMGGVRYGEKSLHEQSHGESFLSLVKYRFKGKGLYLLDEPEAALSPSRLLTLLSCIHDLVEDGSQFIIATHSPILMAYPDAEILSLSEEGICPIDYRQTEHYQITKRFLESPERMMKILFNK